MQRMVNHCSLGVGRLRLCLIIKVDGSCAMNNNKRSCRVQTEQTRVTLSEAPFYRLQFKPPTRLNLDQQEWLQLITDKYIVWSSLVKIWEYSIRSMEYVQRENAIFRESIFGTVVLQYCLSNWSNSPVHVECTVKYVSGCTQYISSGLRQQARHGRSTSAILSMTGLILRNKRSEWPTIERKLNIHHRMHVQRIPVMKN